MEPDNSHGSDSGDRDTLREPTEELRYEGPITFDDEDLDEGYDEPAGGKVFLTTVIIAACVVIMVALAMWMSSDSNSEENDIRELGAPLPASGLDVNAGAEGESGSEGLPVQDLAANEDARDLGARSETLVDDYRAIPDSTPERDEPRQISKSVEAAPPATSRPEPRTANHIEPSAQTPKTTARDGLADLARLARSGQVWAAATLGQKIAPGTDNDWTLQVLFACEPSNVKRAFDKVRSDELIVYPATSQGRSCYRLCWGTYPDRLSAERARSEVPSHFRNSGIPHPLQNSQAR